MTKEPFSYIKLFTSMMAISTFTFGGGFVIISMMQKKFVEQYHWVTQDEVLDMTAIAQSAPGALAVNSAIIFGYRIAGIRGAILSTIATILPPIVIISIVTMVYDAFSSNTYIQMALHVMRAGVAAILVDVILDLSKDIVQRKDILNITLMLLAFVGSWFFQVSSITLILLCICIGWIQGVKR